MKLARHTIFAAIALALSTPIHAAEQDVVVTVNGTAITSQQLNNYAQARQAQSGNPMPKQMILDEMINRSLITSDATKQGMDKEAQYVDTLYEQQTNLLAAYAIQKIIQNGEVINDEILRKEYGNYLTTLTDKEYQASHILLEDEQHAIDVIVQLNKGENFVKVAEEKSTGPSASDGGSLGWFRAEQMVKEFSTALVALKAGEYSKQPVKTQFGWHVILLEDTRKLPAPSFESMREEIQNKLINERIQKYIKGLRESANIVMNDKQ